MAHLSPARCFGNVPKQPYSVLEWHIAGLLPAREKAQHTVPSHGSATLIRFNDLAFRQAGQIKLVDDLQHQLALQTPFQFHIHSHAAVAVLIGHSQTLMIAGAFIIGWAGAGGLLQIVTSVCNMLFPKIKGTVTALVMIASSLCNYTILTAASKMAPSHVMIMNIVLTAIGVLLGLFVNARYAKMVSLAESDE